MVSSRRRDMPNLFTYATSELSQDAFVCWLVAWASARSHPLGHIGRAFIRLMVELSGTSVQKEASVELVAGSLRRQHHKIDVYFQAWVDGTLSSFVIEDKTHSEPHSGQLARYRAAIEDDEAELVAVYLKTGFVYSDEREHVEGRGYSILDATTLHTFLAGHEVHNDIYRDFVDYLHTELVVPQRAAFPAFLSGDLDQLQRPEVQWQYAARLRERLIEGVPPHLRAGRWAIGRVNRGTSMGTPWTHVVVGSYPVEDGLHETLFYRIDRRKNGYYVALRQWSPVKGRGPEVREAKLQRLRGYRAQTRALELESTDPPVKLGRATADNVGNQESEVFVLFFDEKHNTPRALLEQVPVFHARWLALIDDSQQ